MSSLALLAVRSTWSHPCHRRTQHGHSQKPDKVNTVLLVDDEISLLEAVRFQLEKACYSVLTTRDGADGLAIALREKPDLVLLDINLPGLDGLEVCQQLRAQGFTSPVLLLTARDEEIDKVVGLEVGADDYITKPFSSRELLARVKAHLRRERRRETSQELRCGPLELDPARRVMLVAGEPVELSTREFDLAQAFLEHPGQVLTRQQLLDRVWGFDYVGEDRVVNVTVGRLREKLGPHQDTLATVRGVGYRLEET